MQSFLGMVEDTVIQPAIRIVRFEFFRYHLCRENGSTIGVCYLTKRTAIGIKLTLHWNGDEAIVALVGLIL